METNSLTDTQQLGPQGPYGPPGGYGPPAGGGYGPPPGGGFGPPGGGGFGPPQGGGFGPPQGGGFGPPGYVPPGYRPPARSGGGGGKVALGCFGVFILLAAAGGFLSYRARARVAATMKEYDEASARIQKISAKITQELAQKGSSDKCIASVNERLAKVHGAPDTAPAAIPNGASLVCDSTDWQTDCQAPTVFTNNSAFSTTALCADASAESTQALQTLESTKPYAGSSNIDDWEKKVTSAISDHAAAITQVKPLGVIAAIAQSCDAAALEGFVDNSNGTRRELDAYTCQVSVTWVDASGNIVGRLKATGHGSPPDSARKASVLTDSEMTDANTASERNGIEDGFVQLQKRIDFVNHKAGATAPKPSAPAAVTKSPAPAKASVPPAKTTAPAPKKK